VWGRLERGQERSPRHRVGFSALRRVRPRCPSIVPAAPASTRRCPTAPMSVRSASSRAIVMRWPRCSPRSWCSSSAAIRPRRASTTTRHATHSPRSGACSPRLFRLTGGKTPCPSQPTSQPATDRSSRGGCPHPTLSWWLGEALVGHRAQPWMRLARARPRQTGCACDPTCPNDTVQVGPNCGTSLRPSRCRS